MSKSVRSSAAGGITVFGKSIPPCQNLNGSHSNQSESSHREWPLQKNVCARNQEHTPIFIFCRFCEESGCEGSSTVGCNFFLYSEFSTKWRTNCRMASSGSQSDSDSQAGKKPPSKAAPAIKGNSSGNGNRTTPPAAAINGSMLKRSLSLTPARSGIMSPGQSRSRSGDPRGAAENEKRKSSVGALVRSRNSVVGALPEATPSEIAAAKPSVLIQVSLFVFESMARTGCA